MVRVGRHGLLDLFRQVPMGTLGLETLRQLDDVDPPVAIRVDLVEQRLEFGLVHCIPLSRSRAPEAHVPTTLPHRRQHADDPVSYTHLTLPTKA